MSIASVFRGRRWSFTLVELLVVVAIIAVLASMLLPSLAVARARGYTIACVSMQKQYGMATAMYADASDEMMLDIYSHLDPESGLPSYLSGKEAMPEVLARCPGDGSSDVMGRVQAFTIYGGIKVSLGGNENALSASARPTRNGPMAFWTRRPLFEVDPEHLMVWTDYQVHPVLGPQTAAIAKPDANCMGTLCFRHLGRANACYFDGHVGWMRPRVDTVNQGHDLATGGWPTDTVSNIGKFYKTYRPFGLYAAAPGAGTNSGDYPDLNYQ